MPNPLTSVRPNAKFKIGPGIIARKEPALSLRMLEAITFWAFTEHQVGVLLAAILGADSVPAIEDAINNPSSKAQRTLLAKHAAERLGQELLDLVSSLLNMMLTGQRKRNPLAHWLSGHAPDIPNAILLANPTDLWRFQASLRVGITAWGGSEFQPLNFPHDKIMIYVERDFAEMIEETNELNTATELVALLVSRGLPGPGQVYSRLLALPRFRIALERTRADRRKEQEAPPQ